MNFAETIERQWSDYEDRHRNRNSLLIHIVAVPVFWVATFQAVGGLFLLLLGVPGAFEMVFWAAVIMAASLFLQDVGHKMEATPPDKFSNAGDFALRIAAEQYVNFPRFVLTGGWLSNLRRRGPDA
jgi:hypothetical protein